MNQSKVVVVGGGISGLSAAWFLQRVGVVVLVLEKGSSPGGTMQTVEDNGWLVESGPNSALETTPLFGEMFAALGITGEVRYANSVAAKRYVLRNGTLHALPQGPVSFVGSDLWSAKAKLRLLWEPFVGRATEEESVAQFVRRRLGPEFLDYAVDPFVAGVYAGDPEQLSVRAAFPKLYVLEEKYGSLTKGMIRGRKERARRAEQAKGRARMFSFARGMQTFPRAIAAALGDRFKPACTVTAIKRKETDNGAANYSVEFQEEGRGSSSVQTGAVVLAVPAYGAAQLVRHYSETLSSLLSGIYYPPVAEVFLGFRTDQIKRLLDGFGFLVPSRERRRILGTIWSSSIFERRAPQGYVALTTFVGGSRQPSLVNEDDARLMGIVMEELQSILGVGGYPAYSRVTRWDRAIPQYNLGYSRILEAIDTFEAQQPGMFICSNYRGGIAVGDCVVSSEKVATKVLQFLQVEQDIGQHKQPVGV